jgi:hypothetical protein
MRLKGISDFILNSKQAPARYLMNILEFGKLKEFRLMMLLKIIKYEFGGRNAW